MSHPLEAYFYENKNGHIPDSQAKDNLNDLVNNVDLLKDVCTLFANEKNDDSTCYAVGKLYDVKGESYGCITMLSIDVVNVIGQEFLDDTQQKLNYLLIGTYIEYKRFCKGYSNEICNAWDDYLNIVLSRNFLPLYNNGVRVKLIHNKVLDKTTLPVLIFVVYQKYDALYG